jgi:nitrate reductase delta subunit
MNSRRQQLEAVAALFIYPQSDYTNAVENASALAVPVAPALVEFAREIRNTPLNNLQEIYTSTFDLQPACALDLGWHLFGEEYERGLLLARMRRELRAHGIPENRELPDHLSHALLLLAQMEAADAEEFAAAVMGPALERMLKRMPAENPFGGLLRATRELIGFHFPAAFAPVSAQAEGAML